MKATLLTNAPIMAFLASAKPDEAKLFYSETLGLKFLEDNGFSLIFAVGNGLELRIQKVDAFAPLTSTVFGWQVDNIEQFVTGLASKGVQFEQIGLPTQDKFGINTFNDEVKVAWFKDPDGNTLSLTQAITSAASA